MERLYTIICTLCIAILTACAQPKSGYSLKFDVSQHDFADTIAIEVVEGRVVVPVRIGAELRRFLLDTGAAQAVVYADTPVEGSVSAGSIVSHDAVGHRHEVPLVVLPPLTIGQTTFTGCRATIQQRPRVRSSFDGIIGFDLVCKGLQMKIDVAARCLVLTDRKKHFAQEQGYEIKYRVAPYYHTPYVRVEPFQEFCEEALFDTGSHQLYAISQQSFERARREGVKLGKQLEGTARASYALGLHGREDSLNVAFLCIDSLAWGGFAFRRLETKTTQGGSHLGAGILQYGSVTFLPQKKRLRFQPYTAAKTVEVGNQQVEKVIENREGKPVVAFVWQGGKAFAAGLREGDVLLKADGHPILSYSDYARYRYLIGRIYTFTVEDRRGVRKEVEMTW